MFERMNALGAERRPFLFIISYDKSRIHIYTADEAIEQQVFYNFPGTSNTPFPAAGWKRKTDKAAALTSVMPVDEAKYIKAFNYVIDQERKGNSYLVNLTFPASIRCNGTLKDIFRQARAKFRLLFKDNFTVFSPERFIRIEHDVISTCPMKGTISAEKENAEYIIKNDAKEIAEHVTVVDLLRNDLGRIGKNVAVDHFRYIDEIAASAGNRILQVSSSITADLERDWHSRIGDILDILLPAGSVTGAPKKKTLEIIAEAEQYERGYYTGVMGYYDGNILDSAVMIRFIEKTESGLVYKSGGGITIYSNAASEYQELKEKIYVPVY
jgi:para-aminobenzoate synthetase component I